METRAALAGGAGMTGYWPWWAGALGLGLIAVAYPLWTGRTLGVSGAWERVLRWRSEREVERDSAVDDEDLVAALVMAGREEFGEVAAPPEAWPQGRGAVAPDGLPAAGGPARGVPPWSELVPPPTGSAAGTSAAHAAARRPLPVLCSAVLLVAIYLGGLLAAVTSGRFRWRLDMGAGFATIVTANPVVMLLLLFGGGVLVGFGTRLAGGCSSGHGLSGCSRLQPASILATAIFFGTAVAVSLLLGRVI
ncbi:MAG TPA: YeeE/YedE thiosulfate transporter family protein [Kineosporiaceae bacterium]